MIDGRVHPAADIAAPEGTSALESALNYLYVLCSAVIAFVGVTVIAFLLRQDVKERLSPLHQLLMVYFVESGLIVATLSILPGFLALFGWPPAQVWRTVSIFAPPPLLLLALTYPSRRWSASSEPIPIRTWISLLVLVLATLGPAHILVFGAGPSAAAYYAIAPTGLTIILWVNFVFNIRQFLSGSSRPDEPTMATPATGRHDLRKRHQWQITSFSLVAVTGWILGFILLAGDHLISRV